MEFSRQEYRSGLQFPFPGDLPDPRIEPRSPALQADSLPSEPPGKPINYLLLNSLQSDNYPHHLLQTGLMKITKYLRIAESSDVYASSYTVHHLLLFEKYCH